MVHSKAYYTKIMDLENKTQYEANKLASSFDSIQLCPVCNFCKGHYQLDF